MLWASFGSRSGVSCPRVWYNVYSEIYKSFTYNSTDTKVRVDYDATKFYEYIYSNKTKEKEILDMINILKKYDCRISAQIIIVLLSPGNLKGEKVYVSKRIFKKAVKVLFKFNSYGARYQVANYIIAKIEPACFCKSGDRKARWTLNKQHREFAKKKDCINISKKLVRLLFSARDAPKPTSKLAKLINFEKENIKCPLCKQKISLENFFMNGRINQFGLQLGHNIPRSLYGPVESKINTAHKENNVYWIHRKCNDIQGDSSLRETINFIKIISRNN